MKYISRKNTDLLRFLSKYQRAINKDFFTIKIWFTSTLCNCKNCGLYKKYYKLNGNNKDALNGFKFFLLFDFWDIFLFVCRKCRFTIIWKKKFTLNVTIVYLNRYFNTIRVENADWKENCVSHYRANDSD